MRILHVTPHFVPAYRYGGAVVSIASLCRALGALGHQVTVFATDRDGPGRLRDPGGPPGLDSVAVRYFTGVGPHRFGFSPALARALAPACVRADVAHIHGVYHFTTIAAAWVCRRLGVPYVISPHGVLDPACLAFARLRKQIYLALLGGRDLRGASLVHFTSEGERRKAEVWGLRLRAVVVPNCCQREEFDGLPGAGTFRRRHAEIGGRPLVLFLGRVAPKKGLDHLLGAVGRLACEGLDVHLAVVGPADSRGFLGRVERWAGERGLQGRVTFTGLLTGREKLAALGDADVFVLPSLSENFGNAVVEAMACRIPVVVSPQVDIAAEVEGAGAGLVVERDPAAIAEAVRLLLGDPGRGEAMGQRGRRLVEQSFHPRVVAARMAEAYREAMGPGRSPGAARAGGAGGA